MTTLTYQEARGLILDAYFKDEIEPGDGHFCFCGTLSPKNAVWRGCGEKTLPYSSSEYERMEKALMCGMSTSLRIMINAYTTPVRVFRKIKTHPNYETALFAGMSAALEVLRQIHIERGERVDEVPSFSKRNFVNK